MSDASTEVTNNTDAHRYEIRSEGQLAGFAVYSAGPERIVFTHTEIDPAMGGRGLGGVLILHALQDVREQGLTAESRCSFVDNYVSKHPEHSDLFTD